MSENYNVFYDSWQLECCGNPFKIGDSVKWLVLKESELNTPVDMGRVDYCYEAHSSDWTELFVLEGRVERIQTLYQKYEPSKENPRYLVPTGGKLSDSAQAKGFEKNDGEMKATGYLVSLADCSVRPAKQQEVTFK